jgi:hypothetical protein
MSTRTRYEVTVTVVVEHVDGPDLPEHWEQAVPAQLETAIERSGPLEVRATGSLYRIVRAEIEDATQVDR